MPTLDAHIDAEWLAKIDKSPLDTKLRDAYFQALDAAEDSRAELSRLEKQISDLDLGAPGRDTLKTRRNALREAISVEWRDRFGLGTRPGCDKPFPWPEDTATRWLSIYEYIEEVRGVWLPEETKQAFTKHGTSVAAWEELLAFVGQSNDFWALFRDSISLSPVPRFSKLYSLMVAGEDDFHWAVEYSRRKEEDPPVHGLNLDYNTGKFIPSRITPPSHSTCFARVTDFIRVMFETYDNLGHPKRFLYSDSKAPAKLYTSWGKRKIPRPTAEEMKTATFADKDEDDSFDEMEAADAVIDALWSMERFDANDEESVDVSRTFGDLKFNDDDWTELLAILDEEWEFDLDPNIPYKSLTINDLAERMTLLTDE